MRVGIPVADLSAGLFCALGILVALLEREQSGKGQEVATSLLQAQIFMLDFQASRWLNAGEVPGQAGNNHPTSVPTGVFKTRDGYINIATAGGQMWERLCKALDAPVLLSNPQFATARARLENRDALNGAIEARLAHRTSADWIERLNAAGVPTGAINSIAQVFADPQVAHLGIVQQIETGDVRGTLKVVGQPVCLGRTPTRLAAAPPERGQHTLEVLSEFGFTAAEIAALREEKVI